MRTVTVSVTQRHLSVGVRYSRDECPVALGIDECVGMYPEVLDETVILCDRTLAGGYFEADLPSDVRERIAKFDEKGQMKPFSFPLTIPAVEAA